MGVVTVSNRWISLGVLKSFRVWRSFCWPRHLGQEVEFSLLWFPSLFFWRVRFSSYFKRRQFGNKARFQRVTSWPKTFWTSDTAGTPRSTSQTSAECGPHAGLRRGVRGECQGTASCHSPAGSPAPGPEPLSRGRERMLGAWCAGAGGGLGCPGAPGRGGRAWPSIRPRSRPTCAPQGRQGPGGPPAGFPQLSHFAPNSYPRLRTPSLPRTPPCPSVLRRLGVRGELPSQCCLNPYKRWEYRGGSHH